MNRNLFENITMWQDKTFPESTANSKLVHLSDEIIETLIAIREGDDQKTELEFADCFILLMGAAKAYGMSFDDITRAIEMKFSINKKRKWGTPDKNGVVRHLDENGPALPEHLTKAVAGAYLNERKNKKGK